jgi:protocatechuate 3,4-dioxygenase beta subunit
MKIGRRAFLVTGAVIAALGGAAVYLAKPFQGRQLTAAEKQACGLTVEAVEGPYFVSGMLELKDGDLNLTKLAGVPIEISGHVYDGLDATKPLAGAAVEIWHADSDGNYHPNGNGPASNYNRMKLPCAAWC